MNPTPLPPSNEASFFAKQGRYETLGPFAAIGLVLLLLWSFVAWFIWVYPEALLNAKRQELASDTQTATVQTETVLHHAEDGLRTVDLWLLTRGRNAPLQDVSLAQLAETLRDGSRGLVDIMLVDRQAQVYRIPSINGQPYASIAGQELFELMTRPSTEGVTIGVPFRLREGLPMVLPIAMRLSAPAEGLQIALALIDLDRLGQMHQLFAHGQDGAVALLRGDGLALSRVPALPNFVGRDVFANAKPGRREAFNGPEGWFVTDGLASDGVRRIGAFRALEGYGAKLLISEAEGASLTEYFQQRRVVLLFSSLVSAAALALTWMLARLLKRARVEKALQIAASDASPLGLFRCDAQGQVIYSNQTYLNLQTLQAEEKAWGWLQVVSPEKREAAKAKWQELIAKAEPFRTVGRITRRDGVSRLLSVRTAPLRVDGRFLGQVGTVEDITELAEQQRAVRALSDILDLTPEYVAQFDRQGHMVYLNPAARQRLGVAKDADLGSLDLRRFLNAETLHDFRQEVLHSTQESAQWQGRRTLIDGQGQTMVCECTVLRHRGSSSSGSADASASLSVILRDISSELQHQRERQRSEALLAAIAHTSEALISVVDLDERLLFVNQAYLRRFQIEAEAWTGRPLREFLGEQEYARRQPALLRALAGESLGLELDYGERGETTVFDLQYAPLRTAGAAVEGAICIARDISSAKREEQRLRDASMSCPLTGLLNRAGFADHVQTSLQQARQSGLPVALLYLDLDKFKPVNDQFGHPVGDALLRAVALRLRNVLRPQDLVARLGGDEFAVFLPTIHQAEDAAVVAHKIVHAIGLPFMIDTLELHIGISVGFCVRAGSEAELEAMVEVADAKLYEAKRAGRSCARGSLPEA
ncbi:diguanylate cyclase domain-containing protein [Paucibacter sp. Y2R2-4]|uniref:diguanylate cyclase domain-containing protein n=1 Tax=Paucibacter sp. Y2R2-4 TaxID=2893553 RepID=UPI0021E390D8|nr:diguanylate cyclase [Paucibacter sp. Y2R2-4]MCV2352468.1 diguanylate cyclase [Paucibacter sp. Y2R2-4]